MKLTKLYCKTHISCLYYYKKLLFIGIGDTLEILSTLNLNLLIKFRVFNAFNIFGAKVFEKDGKTFVLIYSNRFFSFFELKTEEKLKLEILIEKFNLNDWILKSDQKSDFLYFILSSNKLAIFNYKTNKLNVISCREICTLYTAKFLKLDVDNVILAVGTCFSNVLICKYSNDKCEILHTLCGHNGIIFAIDFNISLGKLATASDDRTIRIWNFDKHDFKFTLSQVLYGHESRIWQVCLTQKCLISVGENSSLYFWAHSDGSILFKEKQKNTSYWNLIVDDAEEKIYFSGSDGSVKVRSILDTIELSLKQEICISYPKCLKFNLKRNEPPSLTATNNLGECIFFKLNNQNYIQETLNNFDFEFKDYNILNVHNNQFYLANKLGKLVIFEYYNNSLITIKTLIAHEGKIFNILFMDNIIITCGSKGEIKLWNDFKHMKTFYLPHSKYQWITCVTKLNENIFVVGERCGSVNILDNECKYIKIFKNIHNKNGVTFLQKNPLYTLFYSCGRDGHINEFLFDENNVEFLRVFKIGIEIDWIGRIMFDEKTGQISYLIGFISTLFVVWSELNQTILWTVNCGGGHREWDFVSEENRLHFVYIKKNKIIYCIKNLSFISNCIIKSKYHTSTILNGIELFKDQFKNKIYFSTCGEDNNVFINSLNKSNNEVSGEINLFGHISSIRTCLVTNLELKGNFIASNLLITAGGRSQMMVWNIGITKEEKLIAKQLTNYFTFNTDNLKRKPWKEKEQFFLDSQIRFMDICLDKLNENQFVIYSLCSDASMKIFHFMLDAQHVKFKESIKLGDYCPLTIVNCKYFFVITFTSGVLQILDKNHEKLHSTFETNEKTTNSASLTLEHPKHSHLVNCKYLNEIFTSKIHQSGINGVDFLQIDQQKYIFLTAGDDTDLNVLLFDYEEGKIKLILQTKVENAHFSMITCIRFVNRNLFATCSWDRRLKIWKLTLTNSDCKTRIVLDCLDTIIVCIPDVSKLILHTDQDQRYLILIGEGQEIYHLDLKQYK